MTLWGGCPYKQAYTTCPETSANPMAFLVVYYMPLAVMVEVDSRDKADGSTKPSTCRAVYRSTSILYNTATLSLRHAGQYIDHKASFITQLH